eukprot:8325862-Pyramimonas_sp.AAC.1
MAAAWACLSSRAKRVREPFISGISHAMAAENCSPHFAGQVDFRHNQRIFVIAKPKDAMRRPLVRTCAQDGSDLHVGPRAVTAVKTPRHDATRIASKFKRQ